MHAYARVGDPGALGARVAVHRSRVRVRARSVDAAREAREETQQQQHEGRRPARTPLRTVSVRCAVGRVRLRGGG
eukprot:79568-Rhodomonas_salina.3